MNLRLLTGLSLVALGVACGEGLSSGNGGAAGSVNTGAGGLGGSGGLGGDGGLGGNGGTGLGGDGGGPGNLCLTPDPVVCTPSDSCHVASCDQATGECVEELKADGALCSDGDPCSFGETCLSGVCGVGEPLVCTGDATCTNGQCVAQACEGATVARWQFSLEGSWEVAAADVNGDGELDVVVGSINSFSYGVHVFISLGNGLFAPPVAYPVIGRPSSVSIADIDADGSPDIVATNDYGLRILLNDGDGTFTLAGSYDTSTAIRSVALADFGGDGLTDIAVANQVSDTVTVFTNQGNATLSAQAPLLVGGDVLAIVAADMDGDGLVDLAAAASQSEQIGVLKNLGGNTFAPFVGQHYDQFQNDAPFWLSAADFNGDGAVDLMALTYDSSPLSYTSFLENLGNGTFEVASEVATDFVDSQSFPLRQSTIADLNSDGLPDAVVNGQVLLNQGDFMFSTTTLDEPLRYRVSTAADFNEDGFTDVAFVKYYSIELGFNDGTGTLTSASTYALPSTKYQLDTADLDNDGDFDVIVSGDGPTIFFPNSGTGRLSSPIEIAGLNFSQSLKAIDLDSDGDTDLFGIFSNSDGDAEYRVVENLGGAEFSAPSAVSTIGFGYGALADMDGDGLPDIIGGVYPSSNLGIMRNLGNGSFAPAVEYPVAGGLGAVATGDFNGDGQEDVALASEGVRVLLNQGGGTLGAALEVDTGLRYGIVAGDFNGDGITDLATRGITAAVRVLLNSGSATFTGVDYALPEALLQFRLETVDLNADGALDLLAKVTGDSAGVLINQGDGSFGAVETYYIAPALEGLTAADIDMNGLPDLIGMAASAGPSFLRVWQMECPP